MLGLYPGDNVLHPMNPPLFSTPWENFRSTSSLTKKENKPTFRKLFLSYLSYRSPLRLSVSIPSLKKRKKENILQNSSKAQAPPSDKEASTARYTLQHQQGINSSSKLILHYPIRHTHPSSFLPSLPPAPLKPHLTSL